MKNTRKIQIKQGIIHLYFNLKCFTNVFNFFNSKRKHDKEFGVARGIDFQSVSVVINYDFPLDIYSYIHRVGRTARGKNKVKKNYNLAHLSNYN